MTKQHLFAALLFAASLSTVHADNTEQKEIQSQPAIYSPAEIKHTTAVLEDLNRVNLMEIQMGSMAKDKWQAEPVRNYAYMLVTDHRKIQDEVETLAKKMDIKLADNDECMSPEEHQRIMELKDLNGADFDQAYVQTMAKGHQETIERLKRAKKTANAPTRDLINKTLPLLRKHQKEAKQLVLNVNTKQKPI